MEITLQNLQKKVPVHSGKIRRLLFRVLKGEKVKASGWINVCFVDNARIKKFNKKFHKINSSTDVLAFDLKDKTGKAVMADILVSAEKASQQAALYKNSVEQELLLYSCHGLLHILGYDDRTAAQAKIMRKKESQYVH